MMTKEYETDSKDRAKLLYKLKYVYFMSKRQELLCKDLQVVSKRNKLELI